MMVAVPDRMRMCRRWIHHAQVADAYRLKTGLAHPNWGTGSLMEVARQHPMAAEPGFDHPEYLAALRVVLACLQRSAITCARMSP